MLGCSSPTAEIMSLRNHLNAPHKYILLAAPPGTWIETGEETPSFAVIFTLFICLSEGKALVVTHLSQG